MMRSWFAAVALAVTAMDCAGSAPPSVDVVGAPADLQQLAGSWRGTFQNPQLRREGQIEFDMSATADSATGDVTMYLESPSHPIWARPSGGTSEAGGTPQGWRRISVFAAAAVHAATPAAGVGGAGPFAGGLRCNPQAAVRRGR